MTQTPRDPEFDTDERRPYPTIVQVAPDRWESLEQMAGTPDFVVTKVPAGARMTTSRDEVRVKWRSSAKATRYRSLEVAIRSLQEGAY